MNAVQEPVRSYIDSSSVFDYELTKQQRALFEKFDKIIHYLALANKRPPNVRLKRVDYVDLDGKVRRLSGGARSLENVTHRGFPILSVAGDD